MNVRAFKHRDIEEVSPWFKHYGIEMLFPQIGFLGYDDNGSIAAAFLRRIEGGFGLFDGLIADPKSSGKRRSAALDLVVRRLIEETRRLDITKILGFSAESAVLRRSLKHGFNLQPDRFIILGS